jgi:hypothetical protein
MNVKIFLEALARIATQNCKLFYWCCGELLIWFQTCCVVEAILRSRSCENESISQEPGKYYYNRQTQIRRLRWCEPHIDLVLVVRNTGPSGMALANRLRGLLREGCAKLKQGDVPR